MSSPHDALFKATFSNLENARSELALVLPNEVVERIDWSSLALEPGEFVDDDLANLASDLLYTVRIDGVTTSVYVLFEHQSSVDRTMPLRLLRYMTRIWARFAKDRPGTQLPAIIPVVLHHSSTGWNAPTRFSQLVELNDELRPILRDFVPDFTFVLDDLSHVDDGALMSRAMTALGRIALLLLKRVRGGADPVEVLRPWTEVLREVANAPTGVEAVLLVARYILKVAEGASRPLLQYLKALGPHAEEAAMTMADELIAEGRAEGRAKGRAEGRAEGEISMLLRLLTLRYGPLSPEAEQHLREATSEQRALWTDRVLTAASLEELFQP